MVKVRCTNTKGSLSEARKVVGKNLQAPSFRWGLLTPIEEYSRLPVDTIKEYYKKEIAFQMAEEILKHPEFFKLTDTGFGYKYDLAIVKIE